MPSEDRSRRRARLFYTVVLPVCWAAVSLLHFREPGDEYALYFVSSFAGTWFFFFGLIQAGDLHEPWLRWSVAAAGAVAMVGVGSLLVAVRLRVYLWLLLFVGGAGFVLWDVLGSFPSLDHALSKNGSWQAYLCFSSLIGSYIAAVLGIVFGSIRLVPPLVSAERRHRHLS